MRTAIIGVILAVAIFLSLVVQELIPAMHVFMGARVLLIPLLLCLGALTLPTWALLPLALYTGLLVDLMYLHPVGGQVEIALGWSMLYFVLFGLFAHGFQPAFERGHWWLYPLLSAVGTSVYLALQFAMITFRREGFVFNELVFWRILAPGLMAALIAPFIQLILWQTTQFLPGASQRRRRWLEQ